MNGHRILAVLLGSYALLLVTDFAQARTGAGQDAAPVIRTRAIELVDEGGRVRSRLNVESDGEVVLRLLDQDGTIRVKLGAGRDGSGLVLLDDATEPGVQILAKAPGGTVTLRNRAGAERVLAP